MCLCRVTVAQRKGGLCIRRGARLRERKAGQNMGRWEKLLRLVLPPGTRVITLHARYNTVLFSKHK